MMRTRLVSVLALAALLSTGCSLQKLAVNAMAKTFSKGIAAFMSEDNLRIARTALESNVKLIEILLCGSPDNKRLLSIAAQAFGAYAMAFVEIDLLEARAKGKDELADKIKASASKLYLKARNFGMRVLIQNDAFAKAIKKRDIAPLVKALKAFDVDDVKALFWTAFPWVGAINLGKDNPEMLADLPKVAVIMERIRQLNERFFNGATHLFFGGYYAGRPKILGGDPQKARKHFEKALKISKGKFLLAKVFYAQMGAVALRDKKLFTRLLQEVIDAPADIMPSAGLPNAIAKLKAKYLLKMKEDLFD